MDPSGSGAMPFGYGTLLPTRAPARVPPSIPDDNMQERCDSCKAADNPIDVMDVVEMLERATQAFSKDYGEGLDDINCKSVADTAACEKEVQQQQVVLRKFTTEAARIVAGAEQSACLLNNRNIEPDCPATTNQRRELFKNANVGSQWRQMAEDDALIVSDVKGNVKEAPPENRGMPYFLLF